MRRRKGCEEGLRLKVLSLQGARLTDTASIKL